MECNMEIANALGSLAKKVEQRGLMIETVERSAA